jgi:hypothetical protein
MQDQDRQGIEKPHSASGSGGPASAGTPGPLSGRVVGLGDDNGHTDTWSSLLQELQLLLVCNFSFLCF